MWGRSVRCLVTVALILSSASMVAAAQAPAKVYRIGWLGDGNPPSGANRSSGEFQQGLRDIGYVEGRNLGTPFAEIGGDWKIGDSDKICTSMRIGPVTLPPRCQFWFKYGDEYFLSDYDSDRSARVLRRTLKQ